MSETEVDPRPIEKISALEEPVKRILEFVEKLPDQYKEKAFEKLLENAIASNLNNTVGSLSGSQNVNRFEAPIEVRAFLAQFSIPEEDIHKHFLVDDPGKIFPKYELKTKKIARKQIQLACMIALENALLTGEFEFSMNSVKERCKDHKCYSQSNFTTHFKMKKSLFKSLDDAEHVILASEGKEYLADTLDELSNET